MSTLQEFITKLEAFIAGYECAGASTQEVITKALPILLEQLSMAKNMEEKHKLLTLQLEGMDDSLKHILDIMNVKKGEL